MSTAPSDTPDLRQRAGRYRRQPTGYRAFIPQPLPPNPPLQKVAEIERFLGITYAGSNSLVSRLTRIGLLQEINGQKRHRVFRYAPYLDLFSDTQRPSML